MHVVVLDKDADFLKQVEHYFQQLEFDCSLFEKQADLYRWIKANPNTRVHFVLVGISEDDESGFAQSNVILDLLKPSSTPSVIFLLSEYNDAQCIKAVKYGNGHLLKPFSTELLLYSLHYHDKYNQLNVLLGRQNKKLLEYQKLQEQEKTIVETIFANHFENHLLAREYIKFYISPASVFNGDILLTAIGPSGSLYLAVGDVTGHGLPAAIGAMPTFTLFRSMAAKGEAIGAIAFEMNRILKTLLPGNMMMALTLMEMDFANSKAHIWSGGMPDVIVASQNGAMVQRIHSRHSPLTVLPDEKFRRDIDVIPLADGDHLYFYTDGIEEALNRDGEMFGTERFLSLFDNFVGDHFNTIIEAHKAFTEGTEQNDDITLVSVEYQAVMQYLSEALEEEIDEPVAIPWNMHFDLTPRELKEADPIAQITLFIDNALEINTHQDCISTILAELFNNALEHGLLKLDSAVKNTEEGFYDYYIQRSQRLQALTTGTISVDLTYQVKEQSKERFLIITLTDSGEGFDYAQLPDEMNSKDNFGRGLVLVKSLCDEVSFSNGGRTVTATYCIKR